MNDKNKRLRHTWTTWMSVVSMAHRSMLCSSDCFHSKGKYWTRQPTYGRIWTGGRRQMTNGSQNTKYCEWTSTGGEARRKRFTLTGTMTCSSCSHVSTLENHSIKACLALNGCRHWNYTIKDRLVQHFPSNHQRFDFPSSTFRDNSLILLWFSQLKISCFKICFNGAVVWGWRACWQKNKNTAAMKSTTLARWSLNSLFKCESKPIWLTHDVSDVKQCNHAQTPQWCFNLVLSWCIFYDRQVKMLSRRTFSRWCVPFLSCGCELLA